MSNIDLDKITQSISNAANGFLLTKIWWKEFFLGCLFRYRMDNVSFLQKYSKSANLKGCRFVEYSSLLSKAQERGADRCRKNSYNITQRAEHIDLEPTIVSDIITYNR